MAYDRLIASSLSNKNYAPRAQARLNIGYNNNPDDGGAELEGDANAAWAQSLLWFITREKVYAENVLKIMDAWAKVLTQVTGDNKDLVIGWCAAPFFRGAEIIKYTYPDYDMAVEKRFLEMTDRVFLPTLLSRVDHENNWMSTITESLMTVAIFKDDLDMFNLAVERYRLYLPVNIPFENGRPLELMRDLQHTQMGLGSLVQAAEIGWTQGIDLYSILDSRLARSHEYIGEPLKNKSGGYKSNSPIASGWEMAYNHYHNRLKMEMTYSRSIVERLRPDMISRQWGLGTLLKGEMDVKIPPKVYGWRLPETYTGLNYSAPLKTYGGGSIKAWSVAAGSLPGNISIQNPGILVGQVNATPGSYEFTLRAEDNGGGLVEQKYLLVVKPLITYEAPKELQPGLFYEYAPDIFAKNPGNSGSLGTRSGVTPYFNFEVAGGDIQYGLRFSGYLNVEKDGIYTFYLRTENQSALYIGNTKLVENFLRDNRGRMFWKDVGYPIGLKAGKHPLFVVVNNGNYRAMNLHEDYGSMKGDFHVLWKIPGQNSSAEPIPKASLFHNGKVATVKTVNIARDQSSQAYSSLSPRVKKIRTSSGMVMQLTNHPDKPTGFYSLQGEWMGAQGLQEINGKNPRE